MKNKLKRNLKLKIIKNPFINKKKATLKINKIKYLAHHKLIFVILLKNQKNKKKLILNIIKILKNNQKLQIKFFQKLKIKFNFLLVDN